VSSFGDVMKKLDIVEGHVAVLSECSKRMQQRIQAAHATTSQVVKMTEQLQRKETAAEEHRAVVSEFLARFRLRPAEVHILNHEPVSEEFMDVLARVGRIQLDVRQLLRVHHKTALMDIVDEASALQEKGFDRLYKWLQTMLAGMDGDASEVSPLVRRGFRTLRTRAALYKECLADLAASRRQARPSLPFLPASVLSPSLLFLLPASPTVASVSSSASPPLTPPLAPQVLLKRFVAALTRGGPGGNPKVSPEAGPLDSIPARAGAAAPAGARGPGH